MDTTDFIERIQRGTRDFSGLDLREINLGRWMRQDGLNVCSIEGVNINVQSLNTLIESGFAWPDFTAPKQSLQHAKTSFAVLSGIKNETASPSPIRNLVTVGYGIL